MLLTEPPMASSKHRETFVELMMEVFGTAEVNLSIQGIMALYAYVLLRQLVLCHYRLLSSFLQYSAMERLQVLFSK